MLGREPLDLLQNKFTAIFYCLYRHAVLELRITTAFLMLGRGPLAGAYTHTARSQYPYCRGLMTYQPPVGPPPQTKRLNSFDMV